MLKTLPEPRAIYEETVEQRMYLFVRCGILIRDVRDASCGTLQQTPAIFILTIVKS